MPGAHPALNAKIQPREKSLQRGSCCHLLEVSRDLSGLSRELDFFLPRFIRLLSFRPVVPFFLTTGKEKETYTWLSQLTAIHGLLSQLGVLPQSCLRCRPAPNSTAANTSLAEGKPVTQEQAVIVHSPGRR